MVRCLTILLIIFTAGSLYAQQPPDNFRVWGLRHYSGSAGLRGFYREQRRTISGITDFSTFPFLYGNIQLNTQSYLGHPNLLSLTFARLNTRATLFSGKPVSLSGHFDLSSNFINREYVTSLRTDARLWGANFNLANKILPFTASYSDRQWNQLETETGRTYRNRQKDIRATVSRSFTRLGDKNATWQLTNMYYLDGRKNYSLRSFIIGFNQRGTTLNQDRLQILESVNFRLPKQFRFSGNFDYTLLNQQVQSLRQMRLNATLEHQLYASLRSSLFVEQFNTYHLNRVQRSGFLMSPTYLPMARWFCSGAYSGGPNTQQRSCLGRLYSRPGRILQLYCPSPIFYSAPGFISPIIGNVLLSFHPGLLGH